MIPEAQQKLLDEIPSVMWRGIKRPHPDFVEMSRKLHHYVFDEDDLRFFRNEIKAWKEMQPKP